MFRMLARSTSTPAQTSLPAPRLAVPAVRVRPRDHRPNLDPCRYPVLAVFLRSWTNEPATLVPGAYSQFPECDGAGAIGRRTVDLPSSE